MGPFPPILRIDAWSALGQRLAKFRLDGPPRDLMGLDRWWLQCRPWYLDTSKDSVLRLDHHMRSSPLLDLALAMDHPIVLTRARAPHTLQIHELIRATGDTVRSAKCLIELYQQCIIMFCMLCATTVCPSMMNSCICTLYIWIYIHAYVHYYKTIN